MLDATKKCPYCAEDIRAEAMRCRHCRSRLTSFEPDRWHRSHAEGRVAGVCAAVAHAMAFPVAGVRLVFVVLTLFHLIGPVLYGVLWLVIPPRPGDDTLLETLLQRALAIIRAFSGGHRGPPAPPRSDYRDYPIEES